MDDRAGGSEGTDELVDERSRRLCIPSSSLSSSDSDPPVASTSKLPTASSSENEKDEAECVICYESSPATWGLLDCCAHIFCYECINSWHEGEAQTGHFGEVVDEEARSMCPLCRQKFALILPMPKLLKAGPSKDRAMKAYKDALSKTICTELVTSLEDEEPYCPRGRDCLYSHADDEAPYVYHFTHDYTAHLRAQHLLADELQARHFVVSLIRSNRDPEMIALLPTFSEATRHIVTTLIELVSAGETILFRSIMNDLGTGSQWRRSVCRREWVGEGPEPPEGERRGADSEWETDSDNEGSVSTTYGSAAEAGSDPPLDRVGGADDELDDLPPLEEIDYDDDLPAVDVPPGFFPAPSRQRAYSNSASSSGAEESGSSDGDEEDDLPALEAIDLSSSYASPTSDSEPEADDSPFTPSDPAASSSLPTPPPTAHSPPSFAAPLPSISLSHSTTATASAMSSLRRFASPRPTPRPSPPPASPLASSSTPPSPSITDLDTSRADSILREMTRLRQTVQSGAPLADTIRRRRDQLERAHEELVRLTAVRDEFVRAGVPLLRTPGMWSEEQVVVMNRAGVIFTIKRLERALGLVGSSEEDSDEEDDSSWDEEEEEETDSDEEKTNSDGEDGSSSSGSSSNGDPPFSRRRRQQHNVGPSLGSLGDFLPSSFSSDGVPSASFTSSTAAAPSATPYAPPPTRTAPPTCSMSRWSNFRPPPRPVPSASSSADPPSISASTTSVPPVAGGEDERTKQRRERADAAERRQTEKWEEMV
ncbi:hypothetical protein JCM8547_003650 [Rhodosporidiobolus lusitaniae]